MLVFWTHPQTPKHYREHSSASMHHYTQATFYFHNPNSFGAFPANPWCYLSKLNIRSLCSTRGRDSATSSPPLSSVPCCVPEPHKAPLIESISFLYCLHRLTLILWAMGLNSRAQASRTLVWHHVHVSYAHLGLEETHFFHIYCTAFHEVQTGRKTHCGLVLILLAVMWGANSSQIIRNF